MRLLEGLRYRKERSKSGTRRRQQREPRQQARAVLRGRSRFSGFIWLTCSEGYGSNYNKSFDFHLGSRDAEIR